MSKATADPRFLRRRNFLKGAAGVALGLPLLESIGPGPLRAEEHDITRRFLCYHCSNGVDPDRFWPDSYGELTPASFAGRGIAPLAPFADRLLIPRGICGYPVGQASSHEEGTGQALTAAELDRSMTSLSSSISIDQVIAQALNVPGRDALVLRPGSNRSTDERVVLRSVSYKGPRNIVEPELNPFLAYRSIMGLGPGIKGAGGGGLDEAAERLVKRRQSVVDFAREEVKELQRLDLSKRDRDKLDLHYSLIRDVENDMFGNPGILACALSPESIEELETIDADAAQANENFPAMFRSMQQIAVLSLACQYTYSTVLMAAGTIQRSPTYQWDGINHTTDHHVISHRGLFDDVAMFLPNHRDLLYEVDQWLTGELAHMLTLMDSYDEGGGRSLLDNTVVFCSNEFSNGNSHTTGDLPLMIVGGADYFRTGEYMLVDGGVTGDGGTEEGEGHSHRMMCTLLNAVGIRTSDWNGGAEIDELKA